MNLSEKLTERDRQRYNLIFTSDSLTPYQTTNTTNETFTTNHHIHYSSIQLNLLAEFLLDPSLTNAIINNYRHLLIELFARVLKIIQSNSNLLILLQTKQNNHQKEWWYSIYFKTINTQIYPSSTSFITNIELFIACLSMILPNLPQIKPFAIHFMQLNQIHLDLIIKSFILNSSESVLLFF